MLTNDFVFFSFFNETMILGHSGIVYGGVNFLFIRDDKILKR